MATTTTTTTMSPPSAVPSTVLTTSSSSSSATRSSLRRSSNASTVSSSSTTTTSNNNNNNIRRKPDRTFNYQPADESEKPIPKGGVSCPFPWRLHEMLKVAHAEDLTHVVSWCPHGRAFAVHQPKVFEHGLMKRFFCQSKYASFQRQLNLYGFSRFVTGRDKGAYWHAQFVRHDRSRVKGMVRRKIKRGSGSAASGRGSTPAPTLWPPQEPDFYKCMFEEALEDHYSNAAASLQKNSGSNSSHVSHDASTVNPTTLAMAEQAGLGVVTPYSSSPHSSPHSAWEPVPWSHHEQEEQQGGIAAPAPAATTVNHDDADAMMIMMNHGPNKNALDVPPHLTRRITNDVSTTTNKQQQQQQHYPHSHAVVNNNYAAMEVEHHDYNLADADMFLQDLLQDDDAIVMDESNYSGHVQVSNMVAIPEPQSVTIGVAADASTTTNATGDQEANNIAAVATTTIQRACSADEGALSPPELPQQEEATRRNSDPVSLGLAELRATIQQKQDEYQQMQTGTTTPPLTSSSSSSLHTSPKIMPLPPPSTFRLPSALSQNRRRVSMDVPPAAEGEAAATSQNEAANEAMTLPALPSDVSFKGIPVYKGSYIAT